MRNNTDKFLLLSNAGGCRPFQGTNVTFNAAGAPIPDTQAPTPPYGQTLTLAPSNYGPAPVFPAPAPSGPYVLGLPPSTTNINGTWDLYVFDTTTGNRGVIAGGWTFEYPTDAVITSPQTSVPLPATGTGPGPAGAYPITFDLTSVPVGVDVTRVIVEVTMRHTFPDDVRLVLQSPSGTAVALMANAGGDVDIAPGTVLTFADGGVAHDGRRAHRDRGLLAWPGIRRGLRDTGPGPDRPSRAVVRRVRRRTGARHVEPLRLR